MRSLLHAVVLALILALPGAMYADLYVQSYQANRQDRFYSGADKAFLGQAFDWSGVGQTTTGTWATMISPSYFVSAVHYHPQTGDTIVFHENNNPSGPTHSYTVAAGGYATTYKGVQSDLWVGQLTTPLAPADHITSYPVLTLLALTAYQGLGLYVYGLPNRVGRNQLDSIGEVIIKDITGHITDRTVVAEYDFTNPGGVGADEAYVMGGDSGAPTFANYGGQLALIGVHSWHSDVTPMDGSITYDSFVPSYVGQLTTFMTGQNLSQVPEPTTLGLLILGGAGFVAKRLRRRMVV